MGAGAELRAGENGAIMMGTMIRRGMGVLGALLLVGCSAGGTRSFPPDEVTGGDAGPSHVSSAVDATDSGEDAGHVMDDDAQASAQADDGGPDDAGQDSGSQDPPRSQDAAPSESEDAAPPATPHVSCNVPSVGAVGCNSQAYTIYFGSTDAGSGYAQTCGVGTSAGANPVAGCTPGDKCAIYNLGPGTCE